ncbi:MAG: hypothetical protein P8P56_06140 [Yoonia sp.]|nr:hypothetical protein [Yoonia sp.]MDG1862556.1 hypothetical protein [Yoonia sp.]
MPIIFTAEDNEFAAASGSNVNYTESYSYFDHPPNSTTDLTITANEGDRPLMFFLLETPTI